MRMSKRRRLRSSYGRLTQQEHKVSTQDITGLLPFNTGIVTNVLTVAQGSGDSGRIENVIVMKKIMMRLCAVATGTSQNNCYRVLIIYDNQPNGTTPSISDILVGAGPTHSSREFLDLVNRRRFKTVYNSGIFPVGTNTNDNDNRSTEFYKSAAAESVFNGMGGTIASISTGSYLLVLIGDGASASVSAQFDIQIRFRFVDGQMAGDKTAKFFKQSIKGPLQMG